jgi:Flp pilus assembly protein TadG
MQRHRARKGIWQKRSRRRGMVLVTACLALVVLLGIAALTVDVGRIALAKQRAQSVADAAALAAALRLPEYAEADMALTSLVAANNAEVAWPQVTVDTGQGVTYYEYGDEVPGYGVLESNESAVTVKVFVDTEYTFAGALGHRDMYIERSATAKLTMTGGALPSLFAHSTNTSTKGIWITGSGKEIHGDAHSNTKVTITGSNNHFYGPLEYRNDISIVGSGHQFDGGYHEGEVLPYPVDWEWNDFLPWNYEVSEIKSSGAGQSIDWGGNVVHVLGDVKISGAGFNGSNGLLLVEGDFKCTSSNSNFVNVTVVAKGTIDFTASSQDLTPYVDGLLFMSLSSNVRAIDFAGSGRTCEGTAYAPNGGLEYTGSSTGIREGSIIGESIKMTGSGHKLYGTPVSGAGVKAVQLIQ